MTSYNGEKYIKQQIDSIISQLGPEDELIISDDGSTDSTLNIISGYSDQRIRLIHHKKNPALRNKKYSRSFYYATENFANALRYAQGDYIFLSDQDDLFVPGKIAKMVKALKNADCVLCNNLVIDSLGNEINSFQKKSMFSKSVLSNLNNTPFLGCCMAFSRNAMKYIFPFPNKLLCHDLWIGSLCAYKKKLIYIEEPLHKYRVHENNVSPSVTNKSKNPLWFKIVYRIVFLIQFYNRLFFSRKNK